MIALLRKLKEVIVDDHIWAVKQDLKDIKEEFKATFDRRKDISYGNF